jgi:hypothetical protein
MRSFQEIRPFGGWLHWYNPSTDSRSPFEVLEEDERYIYTFRAHPAWDSIDSESLLLKVLYADYAHGYAVIELLGEWNDLFENDFRLLVQNCLELLEREGITKFVLICENVFQAYFQDTEYYEAFQDVLTDNEGWMFLLRVRNDVLQELNRYELDQYFYWSEELQHIAWRKLHPTKLFHLVSRVVNRNLLPTADAHQLIVDLRALPTGDDDGTGLSSGLVL